MSSMKSIELQWYSSLPQALQGPYLKLKSPEKSEPTCSHGLSFPLRLRSHAWWLNAFGIVHGFWKAQNQRTKLKNDHLHTPDNHTLISILLSNLHDVRSMVRPRTLFWVLVPSCSWKSCTAYLPTLVILSCTMTWLRLCWKGFCWK